MSAADENLLERLALRYVATYVPRGFSEQTAHSRHEQLRRFLSFCDARGLRRPGDVTKPILERYQRHVAVAQKADGRLLSKGRQRHLLVAVLGFFKWLRREKLIAYDPGAEIELPRPPRSLPTQLFSAAEVELILNAIAPNTVVDIRDRAMLETLYSTGVRAGELARLELQHVDLDRGLITVRKGKGGADRVAAVGERAVRWLEKYLVEARPRLVRDESAALFLTLYGKPFVPGGVTKKCHERIVASGLEKTGAAHAFRHAAATGMLDGGADIRFIQAQLGHEQLSSTQLYTRVAVQKLKEVHTKTHPARLRRSRKSTPPSQNEPE